MLVMLSVSLLLILFVFPAQLLSAALIVTLMTVGAAVFFCWWGARLKRVSIDQHNLYVAGLTKRYQSILQMLRQSTLFRGDGP